jgi:hypothetical protein
VAERGQNEADACEVETYNEQVPVCANVLISLLCVMIVADLDASTDTEFKHIEREGDKAANAG